MTKLSILIPTLPDRFNYLKRLKNILEPQVARYQGEVEIKIHDGGRQFTTGRKRNELISLCDGEYFVQVDDDDRVPSYYVDELMKAIGSNPDVITFRGFMTTDGMNRQDFTIRLGSKYETKNNHHYRFPNHLCCYKKSLVSHVKFPDQTIQEDFIWASQINKLKLLKSEVHIDKEMYIYEFNSRKRTGIR
jgi:glycosyltransferase involved in cell wall biosynthesis